MRIINIAMMKNLRYDTRRIFLKTKRGHIINGHVPVKVKEGESPVKANGKLIIIDGGFVKLIIKNRNCWLYANF